MHILTRKQRIKDYLFNAFGAPFVAVVFLLAFPFIYFTGQKDFTKKEKLKVLGWCLYAFFLYPAYFLHYTFYLHGKEFTEKLKSNFVEQMDVNEVN